MTWDPIEPIRLQRFAGLPSLLRMTSPSKPLSAAIRVATPVDIPALAELNACLFAEDAGTRGPFVAAEWPGRDTHVAELVADGERNVAFVADVGGAP